VAELAKKNDSAPIETRKVKIRRDGKFKKELELRENDVYLMTLIRK